MRGSDDNMFFNAEEVANHASVNDCWLVIGGNVYDVTNFKDSHPGGKHIMEKHAGKDCTSEFEAIGAQLNHSSSACVSIHRSRHSM